MDLNPTEQNLIDAIRMCKGPAFYEQVRWNYMVLKGERTLTNSLKAPFSRAKKNLIEVKKIKERRIFPVDLSDREYVDFAISLTSSEEIKNCRGLLLPKIFSSVAMPLQRADQLVAAEKQIYSKYWYSYKVHEEFMVEKRMELNQIATKIYRVFAPSYSYLHKKFRRGPSGHHLDLLMAYTIASDKKDLFHFDVCLIPVINSLTNELIDELDEEILTLFKQYENVVHSFSSYVFGHRRRIAITQKAQERRILKRIERKSGGRTGIRLSFEESYKEDHLRELGLTADDLSFMGKKYLSMSYSELYMLTSEVLAIPEVEISVLEENL